MDHDRLLNIRNSVSGILLTLIGVDVFWKVQIKPYIASDSTYREVICMYKAVKKNKVTRRYMKSLAIHTGAPTIHW